MRGYALALLPAALMFARRQWPWGVLIGCVAAYVAATLVLGVSPFSALAAGIALFTIATRHPRRTVIITTLVVAAVMVPVAFMHESTEQHPFTVLVLATLAFFAAAGDATRTRRAYIDQIVQRAELAEQTRDAEASRRVAEDRLRIARDLHDAVAHQISVVSLNTAAADRTLTTDPDAARAALATARAAARDVLGEIGDLLATLRAAEEGAPRAPLPGIAQLDALYASLEASGLHVTIREENLEPDLIPGAVDATVYRLVQESLTNAGKHGADDRAHVWISQGADAIRLLVTNPTTAMNGGDPAAGDVPGHGILGMRERVAAVGGSIDISRQGGTFRVSADLPLRRTKGGTR
ncbi:two-component sensor histidine kinase [Agromyces luteolus]|nr:two-component sensor histidine kinase [Agromyces luteolus]